MTVAEASPFAPPGLSRLERARTSLSYYGWVVVVVAAAAMAATLPGRTHGLGLITKPMLEELAISKTAFAQINLWATLIGALFCLPCGWLIDKYGARLVSGAVVLPLGLTVVAMSLVQPGEFWLLSTLVLFTRGLGQSMLSVVSITLVGKWFQRRLSMAMGIYSLLMTVAMAVGTGLLSRAIARDGWRNAWAGQGWILVALAFGFWLFARSAPVDRRREFSGADHCDEASPTRAKLVRSLTLTHALQTRCFWVFSGCISFFGMMSAGLSLFNQFVFEERGLPVAVYYRALIIGMFAGLVANLGTGLLARYVALPKLLAVAMLLLTGVWAWFPFIDQAAEAYVFAVLQGLAGGMITVVFFAVWGLAYGPVHLGRIQSAAQALTVVASAVGPLLVEWSHDSAGSYRPIFFVAAGVAALGAVLALLTQLPQAAAPHASALRLPSSDTSA